MITFYSISRKIKTDFEKKLSELAEEGNWSAVRALSIALFIVGVREYFLVIPYNKVAEPIIYKNLVLVFTILFFILFVLSIKWLRLAFKKNIFDWDTITLSLLSSSKVLKVKKNIAAISKELTYTAALLDMTNKNKVKYAGGFLEESISTMLDELELTYNFSVAIKKKKPIESQQLLEKITVVTCDLIRVYERLKISGASFSEDLESKWLCSKLIQSINQSKL